VVQGFSWCDAGFGIWVEHPGKQLKFGWGGLLFHLISEVESTFVIFFYDLRIGASEKVFIEN
jgi:hypothetical protein